MVGSWLTTMREKTPAFITNCIHDRDKLYDAMTYLLAQCDGAVEKDDVGFNAVDASVARSLALLDFNNDAEAAEVAARLLYKYRRQLEGGGFGGLYTIQGEYA
jgi:hypothetical protein